MASSGSFNTDDYEGRCLKFSWSLSSQSIENNTSTISYSLTGITVGSGNIYNWYKTRSVSLVIDGTEVYSFGGSSSSYIELRNNTTVCSGTFTIKHNADGTRSFSADAEAGIYVWAANCFGSGSWSLPTIPRQATLDSAEDFTDEENPVITYTNKAGSSVDSLQACIASSDGAIVYVPYRDITKTASSYTFNLTESERKALRDVIPNTSAMTVKFYVKTVLGTQTFYSSIAKTFTIVNAAPTINPTIVDTNAETTALTGDSNKLIRYYSDVSITTGAAAIKSATLKSQKVVNGSNSFTTASGIINDVDSGLFVFTAVDSRGYTTTKRVEKSIVDYIKLTCNIANKSPDASGNFTFTVNGNYFDGDFGKQKNTLVVLYRYCVKGNENNFSEWAQMNISKGYGTYTATAQLSGLDYKTTYTFQVRAYDLLATVDKERPIKANPVFDWSDNDFNFNVPVSYTDGDTRYYFSQIGKALMENTNLPCTVDAGSNYSSATGSCHLIGNTLRVYFDATRSSSIAAGNNTNETVCSFTVNTGGRVIGLYTIYGICANNNSAIYISNASVSGDTLYFDISLSSVGIASSAFSSYLAPPVRIDLSKF